MKPIDKLFADIAREHLAIETLERRNRDSLDFQEVSVWGVERALSAAYHAGANNRTDNPAPAPVALRELLEALERAEFLMRRVHEGDHRALGNLESGSRQANRALASFKAGIARTACAVRPVLVAVAVRGGLIEDMDATLPVHVVVEDWDITDDDSGKKPTRSVWKLDASLTGPKAEELRRLIAND
jgi:hypothetical protein